MTEKPIIYCSFCGASQHEVKKIIAGKMAEEEKGVVLEFDSRGHAYAFIAQLLLLGVALGMCFSSLLFI